MRRLAFSARPVHFWLPCPRCGDDETWRTSMLASFKRCSCCGLRGAVVTNGKGFLVMRGSPGKIPGRRFRR